MLKHRTLNLRLLLVIVVVVQGHAMARSDVDTAFDRQFGDRFLDAFWAEYPAYGAAVGYYKYADRLVIPDSKRRTQELAFLKKWQDRLHAIDRENLNAARQADWALLDNQFDSQRFEIEKLRSWQWDPSGYNVAEGFARLLTTEYAPLGQRLRTVLQRLEHVPAYYVAAKQNISNPSREHTQLAIEQNGGALAVLGDNVTKLLAQSDLSPHERGLFERRLTAARAAIGDYIAFLQGLLGGLTPTNSRSFRLGSELYEQKFAYDIQTGRTAQALYESALQEKQQLHARMAVLADMLWAKYFPNKAPPDDRLEKIGALIDALSSQHVGRAEFFGAVQQQIPQLARWVTDHQLLTLDPDKPLTVRVTPEHQRGISVASIDAPGPYDPQAPTFYNVMPLDDLSDARAESLLREYNRWMLQIINIHEAIPGHYAQLVYANKSPSKIKAIFGNGAMVEGWAVYGERMMMDSGYGNDEAEMWLFYSKWLLRSVCNTLLDYAVHTQNMSEADAKRFLLREAFQSQEEANGKWRRVQLTSVQLTSYFAGYSAIYGLREQLKRDLGDRFDLRRFHEQFLSYGNAPVAIIADLMRKSYGLDR